MKKIFFLTYLVVTGALFGAEKEAQSWKEWAPPTATLNFESISSFQSNLPEKERKDFEAMTPTTQRLAVAIMMGLKAANNGTLPPTGYEIALKIANAAEAGFYLEKAVKRAQYQ